LCSHRNRQADPPHGMTMEFIRPEQDRIGFGGIVLSLLIGLGIIAVIILPHHGPGRLDTMESISQGSVVRIGYANEAPYGYLDTRTGEVAGEAPAIATEILQRMGVKRIEPVVTEFGALIPGLKAGRFDVIAAGMYITPARCRQIAFSHPTYQIGEALIVRQGNPYELHSFEDVAAHERALLGVVGGAVEDQYARRIGVPEARITRFPDNVSAVTGVLTGRVDAFAATELTVHDLLQKAASDDLERAEPFDNPMIDGETMVGLGAFGFRRDDVEFRKQFNSLLEEFLGSRKHLEMVAPFGISREKVPLEFDPTLFCEETQS